MPEITTAQPMVHYKFTDEELASFNTFRVPTILLEPRGYCSVDVDEGAQPAKRMKIEPEGSVFTQLPAQVSLRIFDYLDPRDIARLVSTSKGWAQDFLQNLSNQYIFLQTTKKQETFYRLLCKVPTSLFCIRSIYHSFPLKREELTRLLVSQSRFVEECVFINNVHFTLGLTMKYLAYQKNVANNKFFISDVKILQEEGSRQQKIAVKVLDALLAGSCEMRSLALQGLIMQMPYGFGFFQGRYFPVLEILDLSRSNIRIDHLTIILKAAPCLVVVSLRGCDRLETGDFTRISDQVLLSYLLRLDLTDTAVGEEDIAAWRLIAPNFHQDPLQDFSF